ncbi:hypothetical protein M433DRAFT_247280 [Acidomyces richmondensis BFW]|nr:MAG: hypothetical protein FE78DRAFT_394223 [Acidomyces sp. 'richmondensis']KYG45612.1 hypothetical protein M433DRAFT_247280 [Acidomyces richmondensis BFW]
MPFHAFLRATLPHLLTLSVLGTYTLAIYILAPANPHLLLPLPPPLSLSHPLCPPTMPTWANAVLSILAPLTCILAFHIPHNLRSAGLACLALVYAVLTATAAQVTIKILVGGFRPHFLAVCLPIQTPTTMATRFVSPKDICTNPASAYRDALMSFPSGHTAAGTAGLGFLALYLWSRLRKRGCLWVIPVILAPMVGVLVVGGEVVRDGVHHWHDVYVGGAIGAGCAGLAFWAGGFCGEREA